jgi:uncharacterized protein YgiM (DUF1202 family)
MSRSHSSRAESRALRPFVAFLLVSGFGILFAGCQGPEDVAEDEFVFTETDVARFRELARDAEEDATGGTMADSGSGSTGASLDALPSGSGGSTLSTVPDLDLSMVPVYRAMRAAPSQATGNLYRVSNEFLNVRSEPSLSAAMLERIERGGTLDVSEFVNAGWAKVTLAGGKVGYVSRQYIAKITSAEKLEEEKKKFEGLFYVNFGFVNLRKEPNQGSDKLGEVPGQTIIRPLSIDGQWAKISHNGMEGFVSRQYLAPFMPAFHVRQESYTLPVLQYDATQSGMLALLGQHAARLKTDGAAFTTFKALQELLLAQEQRDVRLDPKSVIIALSNVTAGNVREVSAALQAAGIPATLFIETKQLGVAGITEKTVLTLVANGYDLQSAGHTGDDLRSLTSAQVELELKQSRKMLEEFTGRPVFAVLYPEGGGNDRVSELAEAAGYLFGVAGSSERVFNRTQLLRLPSLLIFPSTSVEEVSRFVIGA